MFESRASSYAGLVLVSSTRSVGGLYCTIFFVIFASASLKACTAEDALLSARRPHLVGMEAVSDGYNAYEASKTDHPKYFPCVLCVRDTLYVRLPYSCKQNVHLPIRVLRFFVSGIAMKHA